jgi:purine-binding chemotaxis protein CheW
MTSDSTTAPEPPSPPDRLLIIELAGGLYGVDADAVREIVGFPGATRLPGAPPHVKGVVNLRGQLLTVVDIGHRLTGTPATSSEVSTVVITSGDRVLGLLVDDVHDVQEVRVETAEREMLARAEGLLTGVGRLGDEVVLVVDIPELVRQTLA